MTFNSVKMHPPISEKYSDELSQINTEINLNFSKYFYFILFITIFIICLGLAAGMVSVEKADQLQNNRLLFRFVELFDMNLESNVPAWYTAFLMIIISGLTFLIYKIQTMPLQKYFLLLSVIFLFMSIDVISSVHEVLNNPVRNLFKPVAIFYWAWIIPGSAFVILFVFYFSKLLNMISARFRKLFILSGIIYLTGAIGFEMLGGWLYSNKLGNSYYYVFEVVIEESLEIFGLLLFIKSLIEYLKTNAFTVRISFR